MLAQVPSSSPNAWPPFFSDSLPVCLISPDSLNMTGLGKQYSVVKSVRMNHVLIFGFEFTVYLISTS